MQLIVSKLQHLRKGIQLFSVPEKLLENLLTLSISRKAVKDPRNDVYGRISVGYIRRILREPLPYSNYYNRNSLKVQLASLAEKYELMDTE